MPIDGLKDRDLLQQLIRPKLNDNRLPRGSAVAIREMGRLASDGRQCAASDEGIGASQKAVLMMVWLEWMSLFFHADCYEMLDAERLALTDKDHDG